MPYLRRIVAMLRSTFAQRPKVTAYAAARRNRSLMAMPMS